MEDRFKWSEEEIKQVGTDQKKKYSGLVLLCAFEDQD